MPTTFPNYSGALTGMAPSFTGARGAYGGIPAPTPIPKSIYQEAQAADPALAALGAQSTSVIGGQMAGQLSPETIASIQNQAATFGVTSGMPGSGLQGNAGLRSLGLNIEQLQQQGLGNYQSALKNLASMQLDPGLTSSLNTYNNALAVAPDPATAARQEEALWQAHYAQTRSPAGGTGPTTITGAGAGFSGGASRSPGSSELPWNKSTTFSAGTPDYFRDVPLSSPLGVSSTYGTYNPAGPSNVGGGYTFANSGTPGGFYAGAAPGSDYYDATLDPSSPDYQPGGAQ